MVGDNVVLIQLSITCPSGSTTDRILTDRVCSDTGADSKWASVRKKTIKLTDITRIKDQARALVRDECVPWSSSGLLTTGKRKSEKTYACAGRKIEVVARGIQDLKERFEDAIKDFDYEGRIEEAKRELQGAFNPDDYLSSDEFYAKFSWETSVTPLKDVASQEEDFRLRLPADLAEAEIEKALIKERARVNNAVADVLNRAQELVMGTPKQKGPAITLKEYDPDPTDKRKGNSFRDVSIYGKVDEFKEFASGVQSFADDDKLADLIDRITDFQENVRPEDPQDIRTSEDTRKQVIAGLMAIVSGGDMPQTQAPAVSGAGQFL